MHSRICRILIPVLIAAPVPVAAQSPTGTWKGKLTMSNSTMFVLRIQRADSTHYAGSLDMPAHGAFDIGGPITFAADSFRFTSRRIGAVFQGRHSVNGDTLSGEWVQFGARLPLFMVRVSSAGTRTRPQDPIPPFPYAERDVKIATRDGEVLRGALTVPRGSIKAPAVVLISGSGPQDRDGTMMGHQPFRVMADYLSRRGVAVLRYDERGVGESGGMFTNATTLDFASDVEDIVNFLVKQPGIDTKRIGLIGHSEGGMVAPIVANRSAAVRFAVLLAAPAIPMREIGIQQVEAMSKAGGLPDSLVQKRVEATRHIQDLFSEDPLPDDFSARAFAILDSAYSDVPATARKVLIESRLPSVTGTIPWSRFVSRYDPATELKKLTIPVLALNGSLDLQVLAKPNLAAMRDAVPSRYLQTLELPGLNHLFQTATTGAMSEYGVIDETFAPAALRIIADWILKQPGTFSPQRAP